MRDDGSFTIDGAVGTCALSLTGSSGRWRPKTATHRGRDLSAEPVILDPGARLTDVAVVLTDRQSELRLRVLDERGAETREYAAIVFAVDREHWSRWSRRMRTHVPLPAGYAFSAPFTDFPLGPPRATPRGPQRDIVTGLPEGNYYVIALDDLSLDQVFDPSVLEQLAERATRITIDDRRPSEVTLRRLSIAAPAGR